MPRLIERTFEPTQPLVARRFFVAAGRHFQPGDTFDWKRLSIAQRRVKQLFDNGKLMHLPAWADAEVGGVGAVAVLEPSTAFAETPAPTAERDDEDEAVLASATAPQDDLDGLNMKELRAIALIENAPTRLRRDDQREVIREHRRARAGA
jgi:hypothetical protein